MLTLSRKCDYALIALTHLARFPDDVTSAREIAGQYCIPLPLLMNILKLLNRQRFVDSVRGAHGGYRLAVRPQDLSLKEIVLTVEGPIRLVRCADPGADAEASPCERMGLCPVRPSALKLHERFEDFLDQVSLADMAQEPNLAAAPGEGPTEEDVNEPSLS